MPQRFTEKGRFSPCSPRNICRTPSITVAALSNSEALLPTFLNLHGSNKYQLGACIVNLDGTVMECGDTRTRFTIQSISKLASLILAISDKGSDYLFHDKVGVEPTGDPFNSIVKLETKTKPFNPFINAGAITVAELHRRQQLRGKIRALFILCTQAVRR